MKRLVEPVYIARRTLDKQVRNKLEGVTVNSLAGVIKQLSSISKHAEDLFGDLVNEATSIFQRSAQLSQRVQTLYEKMSQLDSAVKEDGVCLCACACVWKRVYGVYVSLYVLSVVCFIIICCGVHLLITTAVVI